MIKKIERGSMIACCNEYRAFMIEDEDGEREVVLHKTIDGSTDVIDRFAMDIPFDEVNDAISVLKTLMFVHKAQTIDLPPSSYELDKASRIIDDSAHK